MDIDFDFSDSHILLHLMSQAKLQIKRSCAANYRLIIAALYLFLKSYIAHYFLMT